MLLFNGLFKQSLQELPQKSLQELFKNLFLLIMLSMQAVAVNASDLTDKEVGEFMKRFDKAIDTKDVAALSGLFSGRVAIVSKLLVDGREETIKMAKPDYLRSLKAGWESVENYSYQRQLNSIKLDGRYAIVRSSIKESVLFDKKRVDSETEEKLKLHRTLRGIQIIRVDNKAKVMTSEIKKKDGKTESSAEEKPKI